MSESLRDQLLKAGFKPSPKPKPHPRKAEARKARAAGEPDLAQAFAIRAKVVRAEREAAEREAREKAAAKKERKRKLQALLAGKMLNRDDAEQPRNFEFAGKIRRVYVTAEQLRQLNVGELGVVMHGGRALLVSRDIAVQAQAIAPEAIALLVDPDAPPEDDGVPDDLMWSRRPARAPTLGAPRYIITSSQADFLKYTTSGSLVKCASQVSNSASCSRAVAYTIASAVANL
jgi:uncharacterized protein YaiL (DUF2058 family)